MAHRLDTAPGGGTGGPLCTSVEQSEPLPQGPPLYSQLQQYGQSKVLVLQGNVAFGTGTSMDITGTP